jgi:hypothetical protein
MITVDYKMITVKQVLCATCMAVKSQMVLREIIASIFYVLIHAFALFIIQCHGVTLVSEAQLRIIC